jgi:ribosome maturation factor RimP
MASVSTIEPYKKKTVFDGTLIERTETDVVLSLKGRIVKIPRDVIAQVTLAKSKYEPTDYEMRKMR